MKAFEIFLQDNRIDATDWQRFAKSIFEYEKNFTIEVEFGSNAIEFYLYTQRDLSSISSKLDNFILKPVSRKLIKAENDSSLRRIRYKLSFSKSLIESSEDEELKKQRKLKKIIIDFRKVFSLTLYSVTTLLKSVNGDTYFSFYRTQNNPLTTFEFDFSKNTKLQKKSVPMYLKIDDVAHLFTENKKEAFLEVFGFPHFSNSTYFPLNRFDFGKHSLIVGQTGVGKSKFIESFVKNISLYTQKDEYAVVIIDPHASLYSQFLNMAESKIDFDFIKSSCDLFPPFSEPKIATELTILLFKTLLKDQFNAKMERVLKYTIYLLFLQDKMSLTALRKFLNELEFRKEVLSSLSTEYDYLAHFFETEFIEMQTKFYEIAIMPILVLIDELSFIPAFSNNTDSYGIEKTLQSNFLTTFSLNRIFLGEKATRLIAGLIIQQIFLIAQKGSVNKKIILIIDEVSTVENESLINILSEARKFNLSLFLSQQYLTQIMPDLLKGILSNVYNYFVFKMSDEDAKILSKNLDISFPDEILIKQKEKGFSDDDLKRNLLVTLNPRECLVRPFAEGKFYPCFKAKTMDVG